MFSAGHEPKGQCFRRGVRIHPKLSFRCGPRANPRQWFWRHPNRSLGSARRESAARWSVGGRDRYLQRGWGWSTPRGGNLSSHGGCTPKQALENGPEKSAMPLMLPLRNSSVRSNAVTNSSYHWTRELRVPTLSMLACVLWPEDMRNVSLGGVWGRKQCCRSLNLEEFSASPSRVVLD